MKYVLYYKGKKLCSRPLTDVPVGWHHFVAWCKPAFPEEQLYCEASDEQVLLAKLLKTQAVGLPLQFVESDRCALAPHTIPYEPSPKDSNNETDLPFSGSSADEDLHPE